MVSLPGSLRGGRPTTAPRPSAPPAAAPGRSRRAAEREATRELPRGRGVVRRRISGFAIISVALLLIAGVGLLQVLQTSWITTVGYQVRALEVERQSLDSEIRVLEAQIAASTNLDQLHQQAVQRLGMAPPEERMRIAVDVSAPHGMPLPRRYVEEPVLEPPPERAWWEAVMSRLPGAP
jgi:hypothetical protein